MTSTPDKSRSRIPVWLVAALLALVTIALYWPATRCVFVNYDDDFYVTANVHVQNGLTLESIKWAFLNPVCSNWHPVTVLSHMMDCQLFGLKPWGHHLTSVLLHAVNTALVFLLLRSLTGAVWRSALVAALFGLHPLHVESVAWVAERKDVLSACFGLLALLFYVRYTQDRLRVEGRGLRATLSDHGSGVRPSLVSCVRQVVSPSPRDKGAGRGLGRGAFELASETLPLNYLLSLVFFACGLMSKAMLVTWPFVMLLLDYWPLRRLSQFEVGSSYLLHRRPPPVSSPSPCDEGAGRGLGRGGQSSSPAPSAQSVANNPCLIGREAEQRLQSVAKSFLRQLAALLFEKIPFFALAAAASIVTFVVQMRAGTVVMDQSLSLGARSANALISYCRYLGKLFWPTDLAVFYPHPMHWPIEQVLLASGLLLGISLLLIAKRRGYPFLLMGWLWYCGTLVPVIQLVQTGAHAMADRYTYLPSLGVLILAIWGGYELIRRWRFHVIALSVAAAAALVLCMALARRQIGYWQDGETLFRHALAVTENNYVAHSHLGTALGMKGQIDDAISECQEAIRLKPVYAAAHNNLGVALLNKGQIDEAIIQLQEAIRLKPGSAEAHYNLGTALGMNGQTDEAINQFQEAIRLKPDDANAHYNLHIALVKKGQADEAIAQFQGAIRLKPDDAEAHYNLGTALGKKGQMDEATSQFQEAICLKPDYAEAHNNLGVALGMKGQIDEAIVQFREAVRLKPDYADACNNLGYRWAERGENLGQARAMLEKAVTLEPKNAAFLDTLGWVLFKLNRPREALDYQLRAIENSSKPDAAMCDHLGDVYAALNQREQAAEAWRKSLSVEPNPQIEKKLADLSTR